MKASSLLLGLPCFLIVAPAIALAQQTTAIPPYAIVAKVGGQLIEGAELNRMVARVTRGKQAGAAALPVFQAQVLEEIISRRLVLAYARHKGDAPTDEQIETELKRFATNVSGKGQTLADYLKAQALSEEALRRQIAWNLVWQKYLARYMTEDRIEAFFKAHRRDFDGTEILVRHILLRTAAGRNKQTAADLVKQAQAIRADLVAGKLTFEEAAKRLSAGPSAKDGGRLGWIGRRGPMDEAFTRAAFALAPGQISPPVRSPFGVHLIRCDEIKPGNRPLAEVRKDIEDALARELLEKLDHVERQYTPVEYTGRCPYFRPGTKELVEPRSG